MKMYFVMPRALELKDNGKGEFLKPSQEEIQAYFQNELEFAKQSNNDGMFGVNTLEDALKIANEYEEDPTANEIFPVLEFNVNKKALNEEADYTVQASANRKEFVDGYIVNLKHLSKIKDAHYGDYTFGENNVENPEAQKSRLAKLKDGALKLKDKALTKNTLIGAGLFAAATAGLTFFGVPAMLGFAGYSVAAQLGLSAAIAGASFLAFGAVKAVYNWASKKFFSKKPAPVNEDESEEISDELKEKQDKVVEELKEKLDDKKAAKKKADVVDLTGDDAAPVSPAFNKAKKQPRWMAGIDENNIIDGPRNNKRAAAK